MAPDRPKRPSNAQRPSSSKRPPKPAGFAAPATEPARGTSAPGEPLDRRPAVNAAPVRRNQAIPDAVAKRMARRIGLATGIPTLLGMAVFVVSYLLVSRQVLAIPPSATLLASGGCFLLGLVGLSYGVLSASWEDAPGSLLGVEQIPVNLDRVKTSLRALRDGGQKAG